LETWISLDENRDTLGVRVDSTLFYRAIIAEGNCNPVFSDTAKVFEKITEVQGYEFTVDEVGGVFLLPNAIKIYIPPQAVNETLTISLSQVDSVTASLELPFVSNSGRLFLDALKFEPEGFTFNKAIKIRVPSSAYQWTDLPVIHSLYTQTNEWKEYEGTLLCSQYDGFIEFNTINLNALLIEAYPDVFQTQLNLKAPDDCRTGLIRINSSSYDLSRIYKDEECYAYKDEGSVEFLSCNIPEEYWEIREVSPNCTPQVELRIDGGTQKSVLKVGEPIQLTLHTHVEGISLDSQFVSVALPEGFSVATLSGNTGEDGTITFTVTPISENLNGTIDYLADFKYCLQLIKASANGVTESACQVVPQKTQLVEESHRILIYDDCTHPVEINCNVVDDQSCLTVKNQLINTVEFDETTVNMEIDDRYTIGAKGFNILNQEIGADLDLAFSSDNPQIASVDNSGNISALAEGKTLITVQRCQEIVGIIKVSVREKGAPVPGNNGFITTSEMIEDDVIVGFTSATDDITPQSQLEYLPVISNSPNIRDITESIENGTALTDWYPNLPNEFSLSNLGSDTDYWINILVRDQDGNRAVYEMHHFSTNPLYVNATITKNALHVGEWSQITPIVTNYQGGEFACENPEYLVTWQYPSSGVISISPDGRVIATSPGVAHIQINCGNAVPFTTAIQVAYEKDLSFSIEWDSEIYKLCGCVNPDDFTTDWYYATYSGQFHFEVWLPYNLQDEVFLTVEASETINKTISSPVCEDEKINRDWTASTVFAGRVCTLDEFISGEQYSFYFDYDQKVELWVAMQGMLKGIANGNGIELSVSSYLPDICIPYIER
jgi:hypothetical protein